MTDISQELHVINVGLEGFYTELQEQNVPTVQVDWRPPAGGDVALIDKLTRLQTPEVEEANAKTISRIRDSRPMWIDVQPALAAIPGMEGNALLHSGPPIDFGDMCDPQQRAVEAAAIFEGWAVDREGLLAKLRSGDIRLRPNYAYGSVGAMCGVISPSMQVIVTENAPYGNRSWSTFNEGKGNVIWMGTYDKGTIERLRWMRDVLAPSLRAALRTRNEGLDIFGPSGFSVGTRVQACLG